MDQPVSREEIIRVITGDCSWRDRERVAEWIKEDRGNKEKFEKLQETWRIAGRLDLWQNEDQAWAKLSERISRPSHLKIHRLDNTGRAEEQPTGSLDTLYPRKKHAYLPWVFRAAAAFLLLFGILYAAHYYAPEEKGNEPPASAMEEVEVGRGQRLNLTLGDGTRVVLNSGSMLRYPPQFREAIREVELEGEAYFDVARNESEPFIVHTAKASVRVLGTEFNISAYSEKVDVEVVVAEGRVAVTAEPNSGDKDTVSLTSSRNEVVVRKGEYTAVREGALPTTPVRAASMEYHLGWVDGNLIFEATPLREVIRRLELYYNRDFKVADPGLLDHKFTAAFKKKPLSKVLDVLSVAMDLKYRQADSLIYLERYPPGAGPVHGNEE
ncbi:FecR family protein [Fodinibius sediminis]|uniref:FecR family protein n=1 Tax=Fodinibius sediminis TaxID=1214077 RepID=A0A521DI55_9BACT|nr:FecR domain-containing protein [Fodinibius sediminis]SMO71318.1 FecR family protein [Fodinibius sediminis]